MDRKPKKNLARLIFGKVPDDQIQRTYCIPVALFFALVVIVIAALFLSYQLNQTFRQLYLVEHQRDSWQQPDDVIECLKLKDSSVVADLGCGVGYFSLKLAPKVAEHGSVLAEDILGESLTFLWIRALFHHQNNIRIIHGKPDDPLLPAGGVDSVLIANSYHEFTKPLFILDYTFHALQSGGLLVILHRGPRNHQGESREAQIQRYQIAASVAEDEIRQAGFDIVRRQFY
jgi:ubiquinone/menaquinone biosynthesis C-methylase UbiE